MKSLLILFITLILYQLGSTQNIGQQSIIDHTHHHSSKQSKNLTELNVHLFPYSHFDVGKLKSIDDIMFGINPGNLEENWGNATQVLNSIVIELLKNDDYQFVWSEQVYFSRWFLMQNENVQEAVRHLVYDNQLSFLSGSWVTNDEACTYYEDIIDQQTLGNQFLFNYFEIHPSIGWSVDSYGHSLTQAWIYNQMGLEGMMLQRIDYQEQLKIMSDQKMQFLWPLPHNRYIFSHILFYRFQQPEEFLYDCRFKPELYDQFKQTQQYQRASKQESIEVGHYLRNISYHYTSGELLYELGNDFTYQDAQFSLEGSDKIISEIDEHKHKMKMNVKYGRPEEFLKKLHKKQHKFKEAKQEDDFFPYRDDKNTYFTGYFVSKPFLKKFARDSGRLLQKWRNQLNIQYLNYINNNQHLGDFSQVQKKLLNFEQQVGILQHRDGITGTSVDELDQQYIQGILDSREGLQEQIVNIVNENFMEKYQKLENNFQWCRNDLYNNQECQIQNQNNKNIVLNVQNYHHSDINKIVKIKAFRQLETYQIYDLQNGKLTYGELLCQINVQEDNSDDILKEQEECSLYFEASLKGLSPNYFLFIRASDDKKQQEDGENSQKDEIQQINPKIKDQNQEIKIQHDKVQQVFSAQCKKKNLQFEYTRNEEKLVFTLDYQVYNSGELNSDDYLNGQHIFSVQNDQYQQAKNFQKYGCDQQISIYQGKLVSCLVLEGEQIKQTKICLQKYEQFINIQTDLKSQEDNGDIVLNLNTKQIKNEQVFYTDSNGLFRVKRHLYKSAYKQYQKKEEKQDRIAGNFYPVAKFISIQDQNQRLTVFNDRAQGGSSLSNGNIQLMVFRQTQKGDNRGIEERLKDQRKYVFNHQILFNLEKDQERQIQLQQDLQEEIFYTYTQEDSLSPINLKDIQIQYIQDKFVNKLNYNAKLQFKYLDYNWFVFRVQNMNEKQEVDLDLEQYFSIEQSQKNNQDDQQQTDGIPFQNQKKPIRVVLKTNIQGTRSLSEIEQENVVFKSTENSDNNTKFNIKDKDFHKTFIEPLDIRTFRLEVNHEYINENKLNIFKELWKKEETKMQKFCQEDCYVHGICVWDTCHCLKFKDRDCNYNCIDHCSFCINGNSCTMCEDGFTKQKITPFIHHTDEEFDYQCVLDTGFFTTKKIVFTCIFVVLIVILILYYVKYGKEEEERIKFLKMKNDHQDQSQHQQNNNMMEVTTIRKQEDTHNTNIQEQDN